MSHGSSPARGAEAVTPSDTVNLTSGTCRALYIGGAGNVRVLTERDDTVTFTGVLAGSILPICCRRIFSTSTTATTILALY